MLLWKTCPLFQDDFAPGKEIWAMLLKTYSSRLKRRVYSDKDILLRVQNVFQKIIAVLAILIELALEVQYL